jgi:hypothetical protein
MPFAAVAVAGDDSVEQGPLGLQREYQLVSSVESQEGLKEVFPFQFLGRNFSLKVLVLLDWASCFQLREYPS